MMPDDLAARRARHQPGDSDYYAEHTLCRACGQVWGKRGCDAAVLGDALAEEKHSHRGEHAQALEDALDQERQARQVAEARADQFWHRIFTLECERDRLRDDLAASELIAARYAAALAEIAHFPVETPIVARTGFPAPPRTPQQVARQALAAEA